MCLATICWMPACSAALEDRASLADAGSYTRVNVVADESRVRVELVSTHKACLQVDARATIGGLPMEVEDRGHETTGTGTSVGEVRTDCTPPSFVLRRSNGLPELPGPVDIAITDASSTYAIRLTDGLTRRPFAVTDPADGRLHAGRSVTLSMPIGPAWPTTDDSFASTQVDCADATGRRLFAVSAQVFDGRPAALQIDKGTFTFVVPADTKPQPVQLGLKWHLGLAVESCKGPAQCAAREDHHAGLQQDTARSDGGLQKATFVADPSTGIAPLTIEP